VEVELSKLQSWVETTDPVLWGRNGDMGLIREHQYDRDQREATDRFTRRVIGFLAAIGGIPAVILTLQMLHVISK